MVHLLAAFQFRAQTFLLACSRPRIITVSTSHEIPRFGGRTDLQFVDDTARAFIGCAEARLPGARAYNLPGTVAHVARDFIPLLEELCPQSKGAITCAESQLPIAPELDGSVLRKEIAGLQETPLRQGMAKTVEVFRALCQQGRLDLRDLEV